MAGRSRPERIVRGALASLIMLLALTILDILVVEGVFARAGIWELIKTYHLAVWVVLAYAIYASGFILSDDWRFSVYLFLLLLFCVEDTLYFLLQGKPIPESLPWLWGNPSRAELIARNVVAVALIVALEALDYKRDLWNRLVSRVTRPGAYIVALLAMFALSSAIWALFPPAS